MDGLPDSTGLLGIHSVRQGIEHRLSHFDRDGDATDCIASMGLWRLTNDVYRDHVVPRPQDFRYIADQLCEHPGVLADFGSVDKHGANLRHRIEAEGYAFAGPFVRDDEVMPVPGALRLAPIERVRVKTTNLRGIKTICDPL